MAAFGIHQDVENNVPTINKNKDMNLHREREVLGAIGSNVEAEHIRQVKNKDNYKKDLTIENVTSDKQDVTRDLIEINEAINIRAKVKGIEKKSIKNLKKSNLVVVEVPGKVLGEIRSNVENLKIAGEVVKGAVVNYSSECGNQKVRSPLKEIKHISSTEDEEELEVSWVIKSQVEDLLACITYKDDIYKYLKKLELKFRPKPHYMGRQPELKSIMRTILVDWMVDVGEEYKLNSATLFMAVSFLDRFLSIMAVVRSKLQLLGVSTVFVAAKFEEIYPPGVSEITYITGETYTAKQVLRMEHLILKVLDFELSAPTAYTFIAHIAYTTKLPDRLMYLAMYIAEYSLLEGDPFLEIRPSMVACGSIALARHCLDYNDPWPNKLVQVSGYKLSDLSTVISYLNETHSKSFTNKFEAVRNKYTSIKHKFVSQIPNKKLKP